MKQKTVNISSLYNEVKATQVASFLIMLNGGSMDYLKCIKLLYTIEKEAINRWLRPVIYDELYSLPHGQVVSQTLDRAEYRSHPAQSFWGNHLKTTSDNTIHLIEDSGIDQLSRAEIDLIREVYDENKEKTPEQLMKEHHNSVLFPEWKDPGDSSIKTKHDDLLRILGKTDEQIQDFKLELIRLKKLKEISQ